MKERVLPLLFHKNPCLIAPDRDQTLKFLLFAILVNTFIITVE